MKSPVESQLMEIMSIINIRQVIGMVENDHSRAIELQEIILREEEPVSRRAAWALDHFAELNPEIVRPLLPILISRLDEFKHPAFQRHILRMVTNCGIPDGDPGFLISHCFDYLNNSESPIAVKMFSMVILVKFVEKEPELIPELIETIENLMDEASPGIKNAGGKMLKHLQKMSKKHSLKRST